MGTCKKVGLRLSQNKNNTTRTNINQATNPRVMPDSLGKTSDPLGKEHIWRGKKTQSQAK